MRSKANIKGHPLHPMLIPFPLVCFFGVLVFDLLGVFIGRRDFFSTSYYLTLAGVGFGLLAAIPGFMDFLHTVPPDSSGKKRAAKHGILNGTVVVLFATTLFLRDDASPRLMIAMDLIGVCLMSVAGWLGGTLVYRNQIGVDVRYANAGKWKEEYKAVTGNPVVVVASSSELKVNQMKLIHLGDKRIVICKTEKGYAAIDDRCTHRGGSLAGGALICGTIQCPWHGSQFDVHTGKVVYGPATGNVSTYVLTERDGKVFLGMKR